MNLTLPCQVCFFCEHVGACECVQSHPPCAVGPGQYQPERADELRRARAPAVKIGRGRQGMRRSDGGRDVPASHGGGRELFPPTDSPGPGAYSGAVVGSLEDRLRRAVRRRSENRKPRFKDHATFVPGTAPHLLCVRAAAFLTTVVGRPRHLRPR